VSGRVGVCGGVNMDVFGYAPRLPGAGETVLGHRLAYAPGGKGANQAVAARRMGAAVRFCGACGRDAFGDTVIAALEADGVDIAGLARVDVETGVAMIVVDDAGENQIVALPGANDHIATPPAEPAVDVWVTEGQVPVAVAEGVLAAARTARATALVVPAPAGLLPAELVARFDVAVVNETELAALDGHHPPRMVLTLGARGARLLPDGPELPALPADVVDTTGAGDCLTGAVAAGLAEGMSLADAVRLGIAAASLCVERRGCQPAMPRRDEAEARLRSAGGAVS
jgi:ribokinase